ncbi:speckle-type POZ protein B-like [Aphidius gifuensis]|uniref:speckle-type POZ protein B-like n=1 Tax=Aphidius gifuensis TaxID=684658 RepID=UPI001CDD03C5|nr:speckle-type POZ protein B-like [Aphidius gifuensis]
MSVLPEHTEDSVKHMMSTQEYVTDVESCEFTYKWTIKKFSQYTSGTIESSKFSSRFSDFNDVWTLTINPNKVGQRDRRDYDGYYEYYDSNGDILKPEKYVSVQLKLKLFNATLPLFATCKISIHPDFSKNIECGFDVFSTESEWMDYITRADLLKSSDIYLQDGDLKISCTMTISREQKKNSDVISTFKSTPQLSADLKKLLLNEQSADVTIKVGKKSFRVIKGILAVRSPIFAAMFNHEQFKENKKSEVVIEDIQEHVFEEFLHYIYTDETKNVNKIPMELLEVAKKYQVERLENICEEVIHGTINSDNVLSILVFSNKYNVEELNEKCLEFIKKNLQDVLSKETFQVYKKNHPEVFVSVLETVAGIK